MTPSPVLQRLGPTGHLTYVKREDRLRELCEERGRGVARFVRTRGHGSADADDLVAGTSEVAWRRLETVPERCEALPRLLGVPAAFRATLAVSPDAKHRSSTSCRRSRCCRIELAIEDRIAGAEIMGALGRLAPFDRDLILLVAWDELTPTEAGEALGPRPVTARSRLHRARGRLKILVEESAALDPATPRASLTAHEDAHAR